MEVLPIPKIETLGIEDGVVNRTVPTVKLTDREILLHVVGEVEALNQAINALYFKFRGLESAIVEPTSRITYNRKISGYVWDAENVEDSDGETKQSKEEVVWKI